jgi:ubiquinone/menaquinone biosynthesis C-methylase UbiE
VTVQAKRTPRVEKLARIYDHEIAPCWGRRFGKLLLRDLAVPARGQVLDVSCGTGYPTIEILRRMTEGSRLIAIDESSAMLDVVRKKVAALGPLGGRGVFFRTESAVPRLSFADEVYDLVVCNLGVGDMPSVDTALRDFARVAKPGGEVRFTLPLAGTFEEFHDLYREVLVKHDKHDALERLEQHIARYPTYDQAERWLAAADLSGTVELEEFALLFRSAREFFFAPVIEYGPLADWKAVAGDGQEMQDVFWYIKEAIDAYFAGGPFHVTVKAGCVIGKKPARPGEVAQGSRIGRPSERLTAAERLSADRFTVERLSADRVAVEQMTGEPVAVPREVGEVITTPVPLTFDTEDDSPFDDIDTGLPWPPQPIAMGSVRDSLSEIEELNSGEFSLDEEDAEAEQELDAFIEGKKRPQHLVD